MKLYYAAGTCSLAPHIALREAELPFTLVRYDMKAAVLEDGRRLEEVNPKGFVPVLELDDGERLTEVAVVLQYIADRKPESGLAPPAGTMARYRLAEWLNFIATEVHKAYWPIFHDGTDEEKDKARRKIGGSFDYLEERLGGKPFLTGESFTVADAYLLTVLNWTKPAGIDTTRWPRLSEFKTRLRARPTIVAALEAEGLLRKRA